jgi:cytochrome c5
VLKTRTLLDFTHWYKLSFKKTVNLLSAQIMQFVIIELLNSTTFEAFMSEEHSEDHNPIKTPKQMLYAILFSFVVPIFVIIGLVYYVTSANKPVAGAPDTPESVTARLSKVGYVEIKDANRPLKTGEEVYKGQCTTCHALGVAGSPKFGDASAWRPRIGKGYEALLTSALKGKGVMGAQGGGDYEDLEIGRAVVYMANAGGAKFQVPQKP